MKNKLFLKAADVCELLEVSTTSAYEIIANLNSELEKKGYLVLKGKVPTKYFVERFYGIEEVCQIPQEKGVEWFHAQKKDVFISGRRGGSIRYLSFFCLQSSGADER